VSPLNFSCGTGDERSLPMKPVSAILAADGTVDPPICNNDHLARDFGNFAPIHTV
jgi:hypothetical protein